MHISLLFNASLCAHFSVEGYMYVKLVVTGYSPSWILMFDFGGRGQKLYDLQKG